MRASTIVDTGPLVAALNKRDGHHEWAKVQLGLIAPPLLTCEAVITETCFLLQSVAGGHEAVFRFLERSLITVPFRLDAEFETVNKLLKRYENVPMSLADACLVRMSELYPDTRVMTLDSDFRVYRRLGRQVIPTISPAKVTGGRL